MRFRSLLHANLLLNKEGKEEAAKNKTTRFTERETNQSDDGNREATRSKSHPDQHGARVRYRSVRRSNEGRANGQTTNARAFGQALEAERRAKIDAGAEETEEARQTEKERILEYTSRGI